MAKGIIEKGKSGLFENEVEFRGKYATMARFLKEDIGVFKTLREAYVTSAILGFINNRVESEDNGPSVQPASIFASELSARKKDLRFIYRMIMLLKEEEEFSIEDYKNRTFRDDAEDNNEYLKNNMEIFNSYACGGLEYLYDIFNDLDDESDVIDKIYELIHTFSCDIGLIDYDEELPDFEPDFD